MPCPTTPCSWCIWCYGQLSAAIQEWSIVWQMFSTTTYLTSLHSDIWCRCLPTLSSVIAKCKNDLDYLGSILENRGILILSWCSFLSNQFSDHLRHFPAQSQFALLCVDHYAHNVVLGPSSLSRSSGIPRSKHTLGSWQHLLCGGPTKSLRYW